MGRAIRKCVESLRSRFDLARGRLNAVSPLATLERGYAIVTDSSDRVVTDAATLAHGELIQARVAKGIVRARVEQDPSANSGDREE
jgi:exodeoxyribonuclease VII large subunit